MVVLRRFELERGWRYMKQLIDLRPDYHRREDRIRAHVTLCWLALLLARVAENATGKTWPELRRDLDRIHVGTFTGLAGTFQQRARRVPDALAVLLRCTANLLVHSGTRAMPFLGRESLDETAPMANFRARLG